MPEGTWASLRQIMYQPSAVWLATENSGDRWLTDQYVMLNVTDYPAFKVCEECRAGRICGECPPGYPDGPYKLTVSSGPQPRAAIPEPDIEGYFQRIEGRDWRPATPTEWSVAEHPGKAMLWAHWPNPRDHEIPPEPCLLGESTWTAINRHYPDCLVEYSFRGNGLFRFSSPVAFAFAAYIRIPEGQEAAALAVVRALDATSSPAP